MIEISDRTIEMKGEAFMKKVFLAILLIAALAAAASLAACGQGGQESSSAPSSAPSSEASSNAASDSATADATAYGYGGDDPIEAAAYKYMAEEIGKNFDKADASIPIVQIVHEDLTNPDEVLVYGGFWVYNYNIDGDTLECVSGGSFPGVMHMAKEGEGYVVSSFDGVADGSDFDSSARELFGESYDAFMEVYGDDAARDELRKITVSDYVNLNGLDAAQYQDYGQDPVELYK